MRKQAEILLINDNHPELYELATYFVRLGISIDFAAGVTFTQNTRYAVLKRVFRTKLLQGWIQKRTIFGNPSNINVIRLGSTLDALAKLSLYFKRPRITKLLWSLREDLVKAKVSALINKDNYKLIITNENIDLYKKPVGKLVVITFHGDQKWVKYWEEIAEREWPQWPNKILYRATNKTNVDLADYVVNLSDFAATGYELNSSKVGVKSIVTSIGPIIKSSQDYQARTIDELNRVLFIGRMTSAKGFPIYFELFKTLHHRLEFSACTQVVDSAYKKIIEFPDYKKMKIFSNISNDELRKLYQESEIYISPSYYEGFGIALLEAMSYGCIPIASKNSAAPELLKGTIFEQNIVDLSDTSGFESKILRLLELDSSTINYMRNEAIAISRRFSFENFSSVLVKEIEANGEIRIK